MRHLRHALLLVLAVALALGASAAPAGAGSTRTLTLATEDVTGNGWNGIYVQQYTITVASDGTFTGTGRYVGFVATGPDRLGDDVRCALKQSIKGNVGSTAKYVAQYAAPEKAYWYDFAGTIDGTTVSGSGTNVNGQTFVIRNATSAEVAAAKASC